MVDELLLSPEEEAQAKAKATFGKYYFNRCGITTAEHEIAKAQLTKVLKPRLDRPELRKEIACLPITMPSMLPKQFVGTDLADQILSLFPTEEEIESKFAQEKAEFGLSVHEVAWMQATKEIKRELEELMTKETTKLWREKEGLRSTLNYIFAPMAWHYFWERRVEE